MINRIDEQQLQLRIFQEYIFIYDDIWIKKLCEVKAIVVERAKHIGTNNLAYQSF